MKKLAVVIITILSLVGILTACGGGGGNEGGGGSITITYTNQNGEIGTKTVNAQTGASLDVQSREGHKFLGYFTSEGVQYFDENGSQLSTLLLDKSITVEPKFEPYKYTVILDTQTGFFDDNTTKLEFSVSYGESILDKMKYPNASIDKFELDGWFNEDGSVRYSNGSELIGAEFTNANYNLGEDGSTFTMYAKFKVKVLTVILDFCDGVTLPKEIKVNYGDGFGDLSEYSLDNGEQYIRTWSSSPYGEVKLPDTVVADMRIYATWQYYKMVNFVYSPTVTKAERVDVTAGQTSILPETAILPGYKFEGWYTSTTYSGSPVTRVMYGTLLDTYYAKWQETDYGLSFITGISDTIEPIRYNYGDTTELPSLTRTGYTFEGWSTGEEGEKPFKNIPNTLFGDLTLVAVWSPCKVNITLDADGGRLNDYLLVVDYESYFKVEIPTKVGYEFVGWFMGDTEVTDGEGNSLFMWNTLEDTSFVAKWIVKVYTVEYVTGTEDVIKSEKYEHGAKIVLPAELKDGGLFLEGWYYDEEFIERVTPNTKVKSNLVLYANWREMLPIANADDLKELANSSDYIYYLENDINLNGENWTPIPDFLGVLYGKGHKIYNFSLSSTASPSQYGLFAQNSGTIRDVVIDDFICNIAIGGANSSIGILVGTNIGTISGCSIINGSTKITTATASGNNGSSSQHLYLGNIAGHSTGSIDNCVSSNAVIEVTLTANMPYNSNIIPHNYHNIISSYAGGIVGYAQGSVSYCTSDVKITSNANSHGDDDARSSAKSMIGGIAGEISVDGSIIRCSAEPELITASNATSDSAYTYAYAGGILGICYGKVSESMSQGTAITVARNDRIAGGIAGMNYGEIFDCYSNATVSGAHCGAIVGYNVATIRSCFAYSALTEGAGICGTNMETGTIAKSVSITVITDTEGVVSYVAVGNNVGTVSKVYGLDDKESKELLSYEFLIGELYWDENVWTADKGGKFPPTLNWEIE